MCGGSVTGYRKKAPTFKLEFFKGDLVLDKFRVEGVALQDVHSIESDIEPAVASANSSQDSVLCGRGRKKSHDLDFIL